MKWLENKPDRANFTLPHLALARCAVAWGEHWNRLELLGMRESGRRAIAAKAEGTDSRVSVGLGWRSALEREGR